jgi:hypothetical protein
MRYLVSPTSLEACVLSACLARCVKPRRRKQGKEGKARTLPSRSEATGTGDDAHRDEDEAKVGDASMASAGAASEGRSDASRPVATDDPSQVSPVADDAHGDASRGHDGGGAKDEEEEMVPEHTVVHADSSSQYGGECCQVTLGKKRTDNCPMMVQ